MNSLIGKNMFSLCYGTLVISLKQCVKSKNSVFDFKTLLYNRNNVSHRFAHYKAAVLKEFGEKLEIETVKKNFKLKESQVLVNVHCCAVNVADTLICSGQYDHKPSLPFVPGYEFSGEISEIADEVKGFHVGDRIIGLNKDHFSALATECVANVKDLWKIPSGVSFDSAAALVDSYSTVLIAARKANLCEGDTVLVTASAGGLGLAAVDLASNLFKAKVIGVCDTEDKAQKLREKGAFSTIIYSSKDKKHNVVKAVMKETQNEGAKVVFDAVGGNLFEECLQSVAAEGSIMILGYSTRNIPSIFTSSLLPSSCSLSAISLTHYRRIKMDTYYSAVQETIDMHLEGFLEPYITSHYSLDKVNDAIKKVEENKSVGKVIVNIK